MMLAEILDGLFAKEQRTERHGPLLAGTGNLPDGQLVHLLAIDGDAALGVEDALALAGRVIAIAEAPDEAPILFLLDASSQRMSRRDELLGLNEYLAHLAKSLLVAERRGHRTIGLLHGGSAAGAFIATALACGTLVALPGAHPEVMDLPSMARVTKLSLATLEEKARTTPVFAPGLENLARTGAIAETWSPDRPLVDQLIALLARAPDEHDPRAAWGLARGGRPRAAAVADRVVELALAHG